MRRAKKAIVRTGVALATFSVLMLISNLSAAALTNLSYGDINNDNHVTISDFDLLKTKYKTTDSSADVNQDGKISILDASILITHFNQMVGGTPRTPTVTISNLQNNSRRLTSEATQIQTVVTDPDAIVKQVDFYQTIGAATTLIGTDYSAPYQIAWTNHPTGAYSLVAKAVTQQGATYSSPAIKIYTDIWGDGPGLPVKGNGINRDDDSSLQLAADAGVRAIRVGMAWDLIESKQNELNPATLTLAKDDSGWVINMRDHEIQTLKKLGIMPIFTNSTAPCWASADPKALAGDCANYNHHYGIKNYQDFADLAAFYAKRYGTDQNHPIAIEVWNEEDHPYYWAPNGISGADYVNLLKKVYTSVKAVDPEAFVINGGPTSCDNTNSSCNNRGVSWLQGIYAAGAKPYMDKVAMHDYPQTPTSTALAQHAHDVMVSNGDGNKPIWITEWGWSTYIPNGFTDNFAVSEAVQAQYVTQMLNKYANLKKSDGQSYIELESGYGWIDGTDIHYKDGNFGLLHSDRTPKPSYDAFKAWTPPN